MKMQAIAIQATQIIDYNVTDAALEVLKEKNAQLLMEWDGKNFEPIRIAKREVLKLRTSIEPIRKEYNAAALEHQRRVNAEARRITTALEEIEKPLDDIIEAEKARVEAEKQAKIKAEQERVRAIHNKIVMIRELPLKCVNKSAEYIQETIAYFTQITSDSFDYEELSAEASVIKSDILAKLQAAHAERVLFEKQQADAAAAAEALRVLQEAEAKRQAEEAETKRQAQAAEDARLAEERRKLEVEQEQIRIANEAKQAAFAEEQRKFAEEQEKIRQENAAKQAGIDEERRRQAEELAAQQSKIDEEKEQIRLEKEAEERRKFEEARIAEREKQVVEVITATVIADNVPEEIIASNLEEKISMPHSTLPWKLVEAAEECPQGWDVESSDISEIFGGNNVVFHGPHDDSPATWADMAFIVRACNSHNALIEEIEKTVTLLVRAAAILPINEAAAFAMRADMLNIAIKKAKGDKAHA